MADSRGCEQCGRVFVPQREHARFCSARCRVAWNREHARGGQAGDSALAWSVTAMLDTTGRLAALKVADPPQAFAVISEAVWWVTIVDATLVRYHPAAYSQAMAARPAAGRRHTEGTFTGLRFVRNRMSYHTVASDFIQPGDHAGGRASRPVARWTWKPLPPPALASPPPGRRDWEMSRYRAYRGQLAGRTLGETFGLAAAFLADASAAAAGR